MPRIVVDTNILFSALIKRKNKFRDVIFSGEYELYSCSYSVEELFNHKDKMLRASKLTEAELHIEIQTIFKYIHFVEDEIISDSKLKEAYQLCKDIDEKDTVILGLAMELDALLWTGDKELIKGLNEKGYAGFFFIETEK